MSTLLGYNHDLNRIMDTYLIDLVFHLVVTLGCRSRASIHEPLRQFSVWYSYWVSAFQLLFGVYFFDDEYDRLWG